MSPNFERDDFVFSAKWPGMKLSEDNVIVVKHPIYDTIIKRIKFLDRGGCFLLKGDNRESLTSRQMGWLTEQHIVGRVLFKVPYSCSLAF